ncbi:MAG: hypothetical protein HY674_00845 [Chloroflexi bacterium]|nr:hypothetical protein [Chloroflexota bacterium]
MKTNHHFRNLNRSNHQPLPSKEAGTTEREKVTQPHLSGWPAPSGRIVAIAFLEGSSRFGSLAQTTGTKKRPAAALLYGLMVGVGFAVASASANAGLSLIETGGTFGPGNLATNGTAFGSDEEGDPFGQILKVNDGIYGEASRWAGMTDTSFVGINLNGAFMINRIAFGANNAGFNIRFERYLAVYTLQYTTVAAPDATTPDTDWITLGELDYVNQAPPNGPVRHLYQFAPVNATGVRIIVNNVQGYTDFNRPAIDELEVYPVIALAETGGTVASNNLAQAGKAFGKDEEGAPFGQIIKVNDGTYGNSSSWVGITRPTFIGIDLMGSQRIDRLAFGRDNTGALADRNAGTYTLQYTTVASPSAGTPDGSWTTIGVLDYVNSPPTDSALRHLYKFAPVNASGVRIIAEKPADGLNIAIDEVEVYAAQVPTVNVTLVETGGTAGADNLARSGTAFGKDEEGAPFGQIAKVNDGTYGNSSSWVGITRPTFVGVNLGGINKIDRIAFGRDNTGALLDRNAGNYYLQYTLEANPDASTPGDKWFTLDVLDYLNAPPPDPAKRHLYSFLPVNATAVRIIAEKPEGGLNIAIDELEVYAAPPPPPALELIETQGTFADGNIAPGGTAFGKNQEGAPYGQIININDGMYNENNSSHWIGTTRPTFIGINFDGTKGIDRIAFGRDNTGRHADRWIGSYTIQYSTVAAADETTPDSDWTTIGVLDYEAAPPPDPSFRHLYRFAPAQATAIRIVTLKPADGLNIAIDEIEVYEVAGPSTPPAIANFQPANGSSFVDPASGLSFDVTSAVAGVSPGGIQLTLNGLDHSSELTITGDNHNRHVTFSGLQANLAYTAQVSVTDVAGNNASQSFGFDTFARNLLTLIETGGTFAPDNLAPAGTPFGLNEEGAPFGQIFKVNDGIYGNSSSWVGITRPTFIGIDLNGAKKIDRIAFGRANDGLNSDRYAGTYTVQYTTMATPGASTPDADWITLDVLDYAAAPPSDPAKRHLYSFAPVDATGVRIITQPPGGGLNIAIDEIEVYGTSGPRLEIARSGADIAISWTGQATLEEATDVTGPWSTVAGATSPYTVTPTEARKFYRLKQ